MQKVYQNVELYTQARFVLQMLSLRNPLCVIGPLKHSCPILFLRSFQSIVFITHQLVKKFKFIILIPYNC